MAETPRLTPPPPPTPGSAFLPLKTLRVNGFEIPVDLILGGEDNITHDIAEGTLTVTFGGVRTLETVYKHMED